MKKYIKMNINYFEEKFWRNKELAHSMLCEIASLSQKINKSINIMEVCGTHTMSIAASGIRNILPKNINLISGPGCPVCVTSAGDIDRILKFPKINKNLIIATFGDMIKVPGSEKKTLSEAKAYGADVRIVYSPLDCLRIAVENSRKEIIFIGVGFETTAPLIAATVKEAHNKNIKNFSVAPLFKLVPPALRYLLDSKISKVDAFILPGHVSAIIGYRPYFFLSKEYFMPGTIVGFEPLDILRGIILILKQIIYKDPELKIEYSRAVSIGGNKTALKLMKDVYGTYDADWRAIGPIKDSGYEFSKKYEKFDAFKKFCVAPIKAKEPAGCLCGKILLGLSKPVECSHFGKSCNPQHAIGPCMVSAEGACAAWYKYGIKK